MLAKFVAHNLCVLIEAEPVTADDKTRSAGYRKANGSDTWHFCTNCQHWPSSGYTSHAGGSAPASGELCNECLGKENNGNCS